MVLYIYKQFCTTLINPIPNTTQTHNNTQHFHSSKARTNRKALTNKDVDEYLAYVPNINRKSGRLFRDLGDKGLF